MNKILYLLIFIISNNAFSQKNLFENLTIDKNTKIIGRYPQYDKNKTYEKYNFIIEDSLEIVNFINTIKLGDEVPNSIEDPCFRIEIIKNNKEVGGWTVNPRAKTVMTHDGHTYKFYIKQISELNKQFPFEYYYEKVVFNSFEEYELFLAEEKKKSNFIFDYKPQFKYEGSFEIEFNISDKFNSPKAISEFLYPLIDKIVDRSKYSVSYAFNDKNKKNINKSYTMTITGPKKIFEDLKIKKFKKENWQSTVESGWFFYKK